MPYEKFKVLLDEPADQPALGFSGYAGAFAETIRHSPPQPRIPTTPSSAPSSTN
jgi:hypothetical protein